MDQQNGRSANKKKTAVIIVIAVFLLISAALSVKELIGMTTYYEKAADAYLAEPFHALPENIYYDTIVTEIDTIILSESDALYIATVKPIYSSEDQEYVMVTHMSLKNGRYYHGNGHFTTLFDPGSEPRTNANGTSTWIVNGLSSGKMLRYDLYNRDDLDNSSFAGAECREYSMVYRGKEYDLVFCYAVYDVTE